MHGHGRKFLFLYVAFELSNQQPFFGQGILDFFNRIFSSVKHPCPERGIGSRFREDFLEMSWVARSTRSNDWNVDGALYLIDQLEVKPAVCSILVYAVQKNFSCTHCFHRCREFYHIHVSCFPSAFDSAGIPAGNFTIWTWEFCRYGVVPRLTWL